MGTNERGAVHIISLMVFVLALFGAWFLYSSYQQKRLQANVMETVNGYRQIIENAIKDPQDRNAAHQYLQEIQDIIARNQSRLQNK
jgi:predicted negative regulator of RcsB-dependent stress response